MGSRLGARQPRTCRRIATGAASDALALCRSCGDLFGAGNALNRLIFHEADLAVALKLLNLALADFEAAGYVERQAVVTGNLGITYSAARTATGAPDASC